MAVRSCVVVLALLAAVPCMAVGRRGGRAVSTQGSFALLTPGSNRAGNDEAELGSGVDVQSSQVQELGGYLSEQVVVHGGGACPTPKGYRLYQKYPGLKHQNLNGCTGDPECVWNVTKSQRNGRPYKCTVFATAYTFSCSTREVNSSAECGCDGICRTCFDMHVEMSEYMPKHEQLQCRLSFADWQARAMHQGYLGYKQCVVDKLSKEQCGMYDPLAMPTKACKAISAQWTDALCNSRCNHANPNCPADSCTCETQAMPTANHCDEAFVDCNTYSWQERCPQKCKHAIISQKGAKKHVKDEGTDQDKEQGKDQKNMEHAQDKDNQKDREMEQKRETEKQQDKDNKCAAVWDQCSGENFNNGAKMCCAQGSACVVKDKWYGQCKPNP